MRLLIVGIVLFFILLQAFGIARSLIVWPFVFATSGIVLIVIGFRIIFPVGILLRCVIRLLLGNVLFLGGLLILPDVLRTGEPHWIGDLRGPRPAGIAHPAGGQEHGEGRRTRAVLLDAVRDELERIYEVVVPVAVPRRIEPRSRQKGLHVLGELRYGHGEPERLVHEGPPLRRALAVAELAAGVLEEALGDGTMQVRVHEAFERIQSLISSTRTFAVTSAILYPVSRMLLPLFSSSRTRAAMSVPSSGALSLFSACLYLPAAVCTAQQQSVPFRNGSDPMPNAMYALISLLSISDTPSCRTHRSCCDGISAEE